MSEITNATAAPDAPRVQLWARIEDGHPVEYLRAESVEGLFAPNIVWARVPARLEPYVDRFYRYVDDRLEPPKNAYFVQQLGADLAGVRWAHQVLSVWVNGKLFHSDPQSTGNITGAILLGQQYEAKAGAGTFVKPWKTDGTGYVQLTLQELMDTGATIANYIDACYQREAVILAGINEVAPLEDDLIPIAQPIPWEAMLDYYESEKDTWPEPGTAPVAQATPDDASSAPPASE